MTEYIEISIDVLYETFLSINFCKSFKLFNSNAKTKMLNKEIRDQPHQQPRKEIRQRNFFTPKYGSDSQLFSHKNDVECFICLNF